MTRWKKAAIGGAAELTVLLLIHALLLHWFSSHDIVSRIFAAGPHVPPGTLLLTLTFVLVRFLAVFALPGLILARIGLIIYYWRFDKEGRI
jgi:hypothetical protein